MTAEQLHGYLQGRTPGPMDAAAQYAVLVPLVELHGELHLLYEVRSAALRRQPGEVCFPGGQMEEGESPLDCALRETREELSLPQNAVQILGALDFICHRGGFVLYPILALVDEQAVNELSPNPTEVESTFFVPLSALGEMTPEEYRYELIPAPGENFPYERIGISKDYRWHKGVESGPIYHWQDKVIWGLTGRITRHVLSLMNKERNTARAKTGTAWPLYSGAAGGSLSSGW